MTGIGEFELRRAEQALLIVDMQNDFVRAGAPQEVADGRTIAPVLNGLAAHFRAAGRPVIFTRFLAGPHDTLITRWSPECSAKVRSCWLGEMREYADRPGLHLEGPAVIDEIPVADGDVVIDKYGYSAFHDTRLAGVLRAYNCSQVVTGGVVTQICVEDTVRGGLQQGFEMVLLRDGCASYDPELHAASIRNMGLKFAELSDSSAWLG